MKTKENSRNRFCKKWWVMQSTARQNIIKFSIIVKMIKYLKATRDNLLKNITILP